MPKLTKRFLDTLAPEDRDIIHWDTEIARFGIRVKPSGAMSYLVQYRNLAGRTRRLTLGPTSVLTPEEARQRARKALSAVEDGKDPSADRQAKRTDLTIASLVDRYLTDGPADKPAKKASSWTIDASNLRRHVVPLLGRKLLSAITTADIQRFQRDVTEGKTKADAKGARKRGRVRVRGGAGTAWRATVVLAGMLAWAVERGLRADNPATAVRLNKLGKRERFLSTAELGRLGEALGALEQKGENFQSLAIVRLLILTGARRNEIASLCWSYVDFELGALRLPDSKTGAKIVPLGAPALDILSNLPKRGNSHWVFPAARGKGHHQGAPAVWRKLIKAADLAGVRLHDLRHGFASFAVAAGDSLYLIGKVLGHNQASTTQRYAHLQLDPVRGVADRTARTIAGALSGSTDGAEVVPLGDGRRSK